VITLVPRSLINALLRALTRLPWLHWRAARLANHRFLLGVVGVIRDEQGRVLLFHHPYRRLPWGLPGGWMGRGESPLEALEREVREESGLEVRAERLLLFGTTPDRPKLEFVVAARLVAGEFRPSHEVTAMCWAAPDDLPAIPPIQRHILRAVDRLQEGATGQYSSPWAVRREGHGDEALP
jgi:ADP-ribose pyrophosphatase YjhB (NUDIX family)